MPINLQGSGNIAEGWGKAPELDAPALGPLVASILANKLARDKMLQEGIGETIKNVREERQGNALLESMKAQGLLPEGYDAGGLGGAKLGVGLAKMIQDQQEFQAREEHRRAMETRVGGRGGRGSRGDGGVTPDVPASAAEIPEDYYGLSVAPGAPSQQTTRTINGIVQVRKAKGRWEVAPKWMQKPGGQGTSTETNAETNARIKALKAQMKLSEMPEGAVPHALAPGETVQSGMYPFDVDGKRTDIPRSRVDKFEIARRTYDALTKKQAGIPESAPAETGDALPTSKPVATEKGYGKPVSDADVEALAWAKAHPDDPRSVAILKKLGL